MDYVLLSVLRHWQGTLGNDKLSVNLIYDIACQYSRNLSRRIPKLPAPLNVSPEMFDMRYFIPKFHLPAHGSDCQSRFSLNWARWVARTYGERIEQEWAHIKKVAAATLEQGPGARHATLDDQWGGWNWRRLVDLGEFFINSINTSSI